MMSRLSTIAAAGLAALLLWAAPAAAQSMDDGSLYSRYGLGELRSFGSAQIHALGGGGTALWSLNYANFGNPATWGHQVLVRAALNGRLDGLEVSDGQDNSKRLTSGSLGALHFGLPLKSNRLGLGFAFEPYSRVNYRVQATGQTVRDPLAGDSVRYRINYEGSGGLQEIRGGLGYRVTDYLSLGASADVIFGIVEEGRRTFFENINYVETNLATSTRMVGVTGTVGALLTARDVLGGNDDLSVAAAVTLPVALAADRAQTLGESLNRDTLGTVVEGTVDLPLSARFGVAYQTDDRWKLVADARYEPWSRFESDLAFPGFVPGGASTFRDRLRFSGGVELLPAGSDLLEPYLQRVAYRLGFYYDQAYVSPVAGQDINAMAVTGGVSLPSLFPGTHLDLTFEAGTRGTTDANLVRDMFYGLSATLNIGERWFVKRKLR